MTSAPFTPEQEARAADIARGIVAEMLQGTNARIRDAISAAHDRCVVDAMAARVSPSEISLEGRTSCG